MSDRGLYSDNIRVAGDKFGSEFLSIYIQNPSSTQCDKCLERWSPHTVSLDRYCVPGRCDTYRFEYVPGSSGRGERYTYFSDAGYPIGKALGMLAKDLDKPQVIQLVKEALDAVHVHVGRDLVHLLKNLAPRSKATKAAERKRATMRKALDARIAVRRAERKALETTSTK